MEFCTVSVPVLMASIALTMSCTASLPRPTSLTVISVTAAMASAFVETCSDWPEMSCTAAFAVAMDSDWWLMPSAMSATWLADIVAASAV